MVSTFLLESFSESELPLTHNATTSKHTPSITRLRDQPFAQSMITQVARVQDHTQVARVLGCAVLRCAVLRCTVLVCAVLCCAVLCRAVLCYAVLSCAALRCAVLCCAVLCCTGFSGRRDVAI